MAKKQQYVASFPLRLAFTPTPTDLCISVLCVSKEQMTPLLTRG